MIKMDIQPEPFVLTSRDLVTDQAFIMDAGVGIGILYEVLVDSQRSEPQRSSGD